jgi:DNA repair protein RAD50
MKTVKKEMEKEQSLNSQEKYREKLVELKTLELSLKDLDQYHNALDRSLMTFHTLKMKEINKVIRELWQVSWYYWLVEKTARVVAHPLLGNLSR